MENAKGSDTADRGQDAAVTPLQHSAECRTVWRLSQFDPRCPRCSIISKVVALKRRSILYGASVYEAGNALAMIDKLIAKYGLSEPECIDRLYHRPRPQEPVNNGKRRRKTEEEI